MNTAAFLEATSRRGMIHISAETAKLLVSHGKEEWLLKREDTVTLKGKGTMKTFWLTFSDRGETNAVADFDVGEKALSLATDKISGLIKWNVEVLSRHLKQIVASHESQSPETKYVAEIGKGYPIDEVVEVVTLPRKESMIRQEAAQAVELDPKVTEQLECFVSSIAAMYHDNPFHNFEHASHVTMSVTKLMSRIVAPTENDMNIEGRFGGMSTLNLEDHTYGITSDPLTQFACVFSALIHDGTCFFLCSFSSRLSFVGTFLTRIFYWKQWITQVCPTQSWSRRKPPLPSTT